MPLFMILVFMYAFGLWAFCLDACIPDFFQNLEKNAETACYCLNIEQTFFMAIF